VPDLLTKFPSHVKQLSVCRGVSISEVVTDNTEQLRISIRSSTCLKVLL